MRLASRRSSSAGPSSTRASGCMIAEARPASCMRGSIRRIERSPERRTSAGVALAPAALYDRVHQTHQSHLEDAAIAGACMCSMLQG